MSYSIVEVISGDQSETLLLCWGGAVILSQQLAFVPFWSEVPFVATMTLVSWSLFVVLHRQKSHRYYLGLSLIHI